mgnify:CR=1 FL=1
MIGYYLFSPAWKVSYENGGKKQNEGEKNLAISNIAGLRKECNKIDKKLKNSKSSTYNYI